MAKLATTITDINQADTAYTQSMQASSVYISFGEEAERNILNPQYSEIITSNNNEILTTLHNGNSLLFEGQNLLGEAPLIEGVLYQNQEGLNYVQTLQNIDGGVSYNTLIGVTDDNNGAVLSSDEGTLAGFGRFTYTIGNFSYQEIGENVIEDNGTVNTVLVAINADEVSVFTELNISVKALKGADSYIDLLSITLAGDDLIVGDVGDESIAAFSGDDIIAGDKGDDLIDGGQGNDQVYFDTNSTLVTELSVNNGVVTITSPEGTDIIKNVETFVFNDIQLSASELETQFSNLIPATATPVFNVARKDGFVQQISAERYEGAVDFLEYQLLGDALGNVVTGSAGNDFINLLDGDDAANGGDGQDVLDGGTGSNFLTGGSGADTFFLDGRSGSITWSTITDFSGDSVNIWGWEEGVSQLLLTQESAGATGFEGLTLHYDLNNDGEIDTSITFSGLNIQQVPVGIAEEVAGNGYLLFGQ